MQPAPKAPLYTSLYLQVLCAIALGIALGQLANLVKRQIHAHE